MLMGVFFCFFKQKTAYEMRISDWSSDVCSSDLLRLRPDRIIVGEVRGPEALDMLKAWNTGHPGGIATVHANSATAALFRIEQLVQEAVVTVPRQLIAEAIDIVVFIAGRGSDHRASTVAPLPAPALGPGSYALSASSNPPPQTKK